MKKAYLVTFEPNCTIVKAESAEEAEATAKRLFGTERGHYTVKEATEEDVSWVISFGGHVWE